MRKGRIDAQVFDNQKDYFNVPVQTLTPNEIRDKLVNLATDLLETKGKISGPKSKLFGELRDALEAKEKVEGGEKKIHGGNAAEPAMKHTREWRSTGPSILSGASAHWRDYEVYSEGQELMFSVKIGRQNGIHVTPTVLFDGLKEDSVSSSWGQEEWEQFLQ